MEDNVQYFIQLYFITFERANENNDINQQLDDCQSWAMDG